MKYIYVLFFVIFALVSELSAQERNREQYEGPIGQGSYEFHQGDNDADTGWSYVYMSFAVGGEKIELFIPDKKINELKVGDSLYWLDGERSPYRLLHSSENSSWYINYDSDRETGPEGCMRLVPQTILNKDRE